MARMIEWPTLGLLGLTYFVWAAALFGLASFSVPLAILCLALAITQHSSLQHEIIHGHPFQRAAWNSALVWPPLTLIIPYLRFRDTHLAHHMDCRLTDPYDDPETNFMDPETWDALPRPLKALFLWNNTLAGRMIFGPILGTLHFLQAEWGMRDQRAIQSGWFWHVPGLAAVLICVAVSPMPLWAYGLAAYLALSLLRVRTFLEHRAHEKVRARSVIVEDRGPLALLFLNNNLHAIHHMHPTVPWYRLPALLREDRERFLSANEDYCYASYREVFAGYFFRRKDPVAHPLMHRD